MSFVALCRSWAKLPLTAELLSKLQQQRSLTLTGMPRLVKGLITSTLAQHCQHSLCIVTSTLEEGARWATQLELMGWDTVLFYPTSEASPYDPFDLEAEMVWGQMQVLVESDRPAGTMAIVTTERALQPHLPPPAVFHAACLTLRVGDERSLTALANDLAHLGYERVSLVETEGQWSRRGDIIDIFPVAAELPVRLEWFGDEIEAIREFDPVSQRSLRSEGDRLDALAQVTLTPISFTPLITAALAAKGQAPPPKDARRYLGTAFPQPASLLDYLPINTLVAVDEPPLCAAHSDRWWEHCQSYWQTLSDPPPPIHQPWSVTAEALERFPRLDLYELASEGQGLNVAARPVPAIPHQFGRLASILRDERDKGYTVWLVSAQPSRSVALLQEHDCPAQFVPNPRDFPAIDKLQQQRVPIALKATGLAELSGFILPTFRTVLVSDREFFGQQSLINVGYVRKRRRAAAKQVDVNKLQPGDYVVHRQHGIGQFLRLETLTINNETREYLALQYADGVLRVAADQLNTLSRFRKQSETPPQLNKLTGKTWERTKERVRKAVKKVAVDLLQLYAQRAQQRGFAFASDTPWQQELEDSFPYQPTPDQLKAI